MPAYRLACESPNHDDQRLGEGPGGGAGAPARAGARARSPLTWVADASRNASALILPAARRQKMATGVVISRSAGVVISLSALARPATTSMATIRARRPLRLNWTTVPSGAFMRLPIT